MKSQSVTIIRLSGILAVLLVALIARTTVSTATQASLCANRGWNIVPSPKPNTGYELNAVAAVSTDDAWAVGDGTLIEHWDGTSWRLVPAPHPGEVSGLLGVTAISATNIWAVGFYTDVGIGYLTLIEHWNGNQWSIVSSPSIGKSYNRLTAVAAVSSNDVWAVGTASLGFQKPYQGLIEHWNGVQWSIVPGPHGDPKDRSLNGVTTLAANDVWAVGNYDYNYNSYALTEHWDGSRWSTVLAPGGMPSSLTAATAVNAGQIWAAGFTGGTLIERWNGHRWQVVPSHSPGNGVANLFGVAASSAQDVWAVGYYANNSTDVTLTEHWNGSSWQVVASPNVFSANNFLYGIGFVPGSHHAWAVGFSEPAHYGGTSQFMPLIEYYC